jgi:hypothetical protein
METAFQITDTTSFSGGYPVSNPLLNLLDFVVFTQLLA